MTPAATPADTQGLAPAIARIRLLLESGPASDLAEAAVSPELQRVCEGFNLSPFERDVLVLCAAMELDPGFAALCADSQNDDRLRFPTISLAMAALPVGEAVASLSAF